jgi:hypothetical protein
MSFSPYPPVKLSFLITCIFVPAVFALQPPAAALMAELNTHQLTCGSDLVAEGTVLRVSCFWNDEKIHIFTGAVVSVAQVHKGSYSRNLLRVEYPGGRLGDLRLGVTDAPRLEKGQRVILFLNYKHMPEAGNTFIPSFTVNGSAQGVYTITKDGIAVKRGFSVIKNKADADGPDVMLPLIELIKKIKRAAHSNG